MLTILTQVSNVEIAKMLGMGSKYISVLCEHIRELLADSIEYSQM